MPRNTPFFDADILNNARAWPYVEAQKIIKRYKGECPAKGYVTFETGYGPSGLPHIGTFGEVARTSYVRFALEQLTGWDTKLLCFSDDMDGMRKVPGNLPNQELLNAHLYKSLTNVPDPFEKYESFAHHNNAMLRKFLDQFGFEYEFLSSTEQYQSGRFNNALRQVLKHYDQVMNIILPTLGEERQQTYSPFLPVCPETNHVLQVPVISRNAEAGTITYRREDGAEVTTRVTDGHCKLQWKPDWAMRWVALDVDYEMYGKDLIDSATLGSRITAAIGGRPPVHFQYEHFVDETGAKISKSKGNGLSIDEWLQYASPESLSLFMYRKPATAKRLYAGMIPATVDEYSDLLKNYPQEEPQKQAENPVFFIHEGHIPEVELQLSYGMLTNLAAVAGPDLSLEMLWGFVTRYRPEITAASHPHLSPVLERVINFYRDHLAAQKDFHIPTQQEATWLQDIIPLLQSLNGDEEPEDIQTELYTIGKRYFEKAELKTWFKLIYTTLFGTPQGPRLGSFVKIYGPENMIQLIESRTATTKEQAA